MDERSSFPWLSLLYIVLIILASAALIYWQVSLREEENSASVSSGLTTESRAERSPSPEIEPEMITEEPAEFVETNPTLGPELEPEVPVKPKPDLPRLQESDPHFKEKLAAMVGGAELVSLLAKDELIRKFVRVVYGLSEGFVVKEFRPIQSPTGTYLVDATGEKNAQGAPYYKRAEGNNARYANYVSLLTKIEPKSALKIYRYFYPLMQQAYEELGLREANFEVVVLKALDVLLQPAVGLNQDQRLRQPSVMYVFESEELEASSGVNKLKLRLGENANASLEQWMKSFKESLESNS